MTDPTSQPDEQIDEILLQLLPVDLRVISRTPDDTIGVEVDANALKRAEARTALKRLLVRERRQAEVKLLKSCYVDQGEIYVKFKGGFAEQYERIKQLEAAPTGDAEGEQ